MRALFLVTLKSNPKPQFVDDLLRSLGIVSQPIDFKTTKSIFVSASLHHQCHMLSSHFLSVSLFGVSMFGWWKNRRDFEKSSNNERSHREWNEITHYTEDYTIHCYSGAVNVLKLVWFSKKTALIESNSKHSRLIKSSV